MGPAVGVTWGEPDKSTPSVPSHVRVINLMGTSLVKIFSNHLHSICFHFLSWWGLFSNVNPAEFLPCASQYIQLMPAMLPQTVLVDSSWLRDWSNVLTCLSSLTVLTSDHMNTFSFVDIFVYYEPKCDGGQYSCHTLKVRENSTFVWTPQWYQT